MWLALDDVWQGRPVVEGEGVESALPRVENIVGSDKSAENRLTSAWTLAECSKMLCTRCSREAGLRGGAEGVVVKI